MTITIEKSELSGCINAEPSKSMAHRLLIAAALSDGASKVANIAPSEDILATMDCLRALGADIDLHEDGSFPAGYSASVKGFDPACALPAELRCRESGSTLRFLMPLAALSGARMRFTGSERLMSRPLGVYEEIFASCGISYEKGRDYVEISGRLGPGEYKIDAGISSQFISGLLIALPLAERGSRLMLKPPVRSSAYIDMTIEALSAFGVEAEGTDNDEILIPGDQSYKAADVTVEGDWSNAALFLAMGVDVKGLDERSLQPDKICKEHFEMLRRGCAEIDISGCPDLGPVLMAYAAMNHGCVLRGTGRLKLKESDRGSAMCAELAKFSVETELSEDSIKVGCGLKEPSAVLDGHNDHRIVMSLAMLASLTGGRIAGAEAVNKSYPAFFERFARAGGIYKTETKSLMEDSEV